MMQNSVKMSDIAEKLGISSVTVSKALAGKKGVSDELRKKIEKVAEEAGYIRKEKVRQNKKTVTVGVIVAERYLREKQSFYWRIYQELSIQANKKKIFSLLEVVGSDDEDSNNLPNILTREDIDGLVVLGAFKRKYLSMISEKAPCPCLSLDSVYEEMTGDAVIADNMLGGYEIARYLIKKGHSNIAYVGTFGMTPSIDDRYIGMCKMLTLSGINVEFKKNPIVIDDRDSEGVIGAEGTFKLPDKKHMPTAFFCNCDVAAKILVERLNTAGYRVPEDISVVGFDNYLPNPDDSLGLTSYEINVKHMVRKTIEMMLRRLTAPETPFETIMVRGKLVERTSVKVI